MIYIEEALKKFSKLPKEIIFEIDNDRRVYDNLVKIEKKCGKKLSSLIVFIAVGALDGNNIESYLIREQEMDGAMAKKISNEIIEKILEPLHKRLNFITANKDNKLSIEDGKKEIVGIFQNKLIDEINGREITKDIVNQRIFYILSKDLSFQDTIKKSILNNEELVAEKRFLVNDKKQQSTVGNWIRDFIENTGSDMVDNIGISKYITNSRNVKLLNDEKKGLVKNIVKTYLNIAFFPDSMTSDNVEEWEIVPIKKIIDENDKTKRKVGTPKSVDEKELEKLEEMEDNYEEGSLEKLVLDEEIEKRKRIEELRFTLSKYKEGSLERKVLEEEILKLESQ
jgi:hypothetical protein